MTAISLLFIIYCVKFLRYFKLRKPSLVANISTKERQNTPIYK